MNTKEELLGDAYELFKRRNSTPPLEEVNRAAILAQVFGDGWKGTWLWKCSLWNQKAKWNRRTTTNEKTCHLCRKMRIDPKGNRYKNLERMERHLRCKIHVAAQFGVSPFQLSKVLRSESWIDGDVPAPRKKKKARKRGVKRVVAAELPLAIKRATLRLKQAKENERKAEASIRFWSRKLRMYERRLTKEGDGKA